MILIVQYWAFMFFLWLVKQRSTHELPSVRALWNGSDVSLLSARCDCSKHSEEESMSGHSIQKTMKHWARQHSQAINMQILISYFSLCYWCRCLLKKCIKSNSCGKYRPQNIAANITGWISSLWPSGFMESWSSRQTHPYVMFSVSPKHGEEDEPQLATLLRLKML